MRRDFLAIACFIALTTSAMAQMIPLTDTASRNTLWFDIDRVFNYNLYERSRWGGGLQYDIGLKGERFRTLSLGGYVAYGYLDQRWKWGLKVDLAGRSKREPRTYIEFFHDLTIDASRTLTTYSIRTFSETGNYMSRLFSDTYRLTVGHSYKPFAALTADVKLRLSTERYLHYYYTLLYPENRSALLDLPSARFAEAILTLSTATGWTLQATGGLVGVKQDDVSAFLRVLAQYEHVYDFSIFRYMLFAQCGVTTREVPYSRMFDLGGTWGSPFFFNQSILTARPNEFTSNLFAMIASRLTLQKPLIELYNHALQLGTSPNPFVFIDVAWGNTWEDQMYITPDKGIAEVGAGIDGLLRSGQIDWGLGVVYRLTPPSADYHFANSRDNYTILVSAILHL